MKDIIEMKISTRGIQVLWPIVAISIHVPFAAWICSPPLYLSWTVNFSSSLVMWSVAPESMYQFASTPYELVAEDALFCGGPINEASNLL
jgi:hypothetical protein